LSCLENVVTAKCRKEGQKGKKKKRREEDRGKKDEEREKLEKIDNQQIQGRWRMRVCRATMGSEKSGTGE